MKYIRVEEGVFQVGEKIIVEPNKDINATTFPNESGYYITKKNKYGGMDFRYAGESEIIKESDNLEDLCDEFVAHWKKDDKEFGTDGTYWKDNNEKPRYFQYDNLDYLCSEISYFTSGLDRLDIYGTIWTNQGLIYVAKMNKDGELELI